MQTAQPNKTMRLTADTVLNNLGLDPIAKVTLLTALMEATDLSLSDDLFRGEQSLLAIAQRISQKYEGS